MNETRKLRKFHAPVWDEPVIMELGRTGQRGIIVTETEPEIVDTVGSLEALVPPTLRRDSPPKLPELSQPEVLRHYLRLSQETLGMALTIDFRGTCTMKYTPIVNLELSKLIGNTHPLQQEETVQGTLEIVYRFGQLLNSISGMEQFSFQAGGGSHAIYTNACIIRKYHQTGGQVERNEIITTMYSHPGNAASPSTAGFKVITLMPNPETGYPEVEALKAAVTKRTAGLMITNPEDTGIFNPNIDEFVRIVHESGGLCSYDQANGNTLFGLVRARDAGFDLCHFNTHKAFSTPHGSNGPACGAVGVTHELAEFLPVPVVTFDGSAYRLDYDRPRSIGKIRGFLGNIPLIVMAYAWVMSMGAAGLREVSSASTLNANYLIHGMSSIRGVELAYPKQKWRMDQAKFSFQRLKDETGVGTEDIRRRITDFGIQEHFTSHEPWIVPEPIIPEPTETYSKDDIDYWLSALGRVCEEAYRDPELVLSSPHNQSIPKIDEDAPDDPERWAMTWRRFVRKRETQAGSVSWTKKVERASA